MRCSLQHLYPLLSEVAELCLSIPVSSAWSEREASCVKRINTRLRSRLNSDMLEALLHIAINGPEVKNPAGLIQTCLQHWFQAKSRRNIKAIKKHSTAVEHRSYLMVIKRRKPRQDCSIFQQMKKWTVHLIMIVTVTVKGIRTVTSSPTSMQCGLSLFPTSLCTRMILRS